jgi:hypothetical protein
LCLPIKKGTQYSDVYIPFAVNKLHIYKLYKGGTSGILGAAAAWQATQRRPINREELRSVED